MRGTLETTTPHAALEQALDEYGLDVLLEALVDVCEKHWLGVWLDSAAKDRTGLSAGRCSGLTGPRKRKGDNGQQRTERRDRAGRAVCRRLSNERGRDVDDKAYDTLDEALTEAKRREGSDEVAGLTGKPQYVALCHDGTHVVTSALPLLGTWWTSDGLQHG